METKALLFSILLVFIFAITSSFASYYLHYPFYYNYIPSAILGWFGEDIYNNIKSIERREK